MICTTIPGCDCRPGGGHVRGCPARDCGGGTITRPVEFPGTPEQARANRESHHFGYDDEDARCFDCDCRPGGQVANYPCGAAVPVETVSR